MALGLFSRTTAAVDSQSILAQGDFAPAEKTKLADDPLAQALQLGRLGLIVGQRDRWADHPKFEKTRAAAVRAVDERFALVPEGFVSITLSIFDQPGCPEMDCETEPFLLARHAVTNAEFQLFVDGGGYEDLELWPEDIWPHLIGFKDQTGQAGPRFWQDGRHHRRLANHPVVGVAFYEAAAYAAWAGFRLLNEAEWQMAASWRIRSSAHVHRRYPWGDALDLSFCNIWASGHGGTLPVNACSGGAAPNGVLQLIGNTWEWTSSDFESTDREGRNIMGDTLLKSIRGGAYDTYFAWQAVSAFRTGLGCLARVHNVGFRCAMDLPPG
ncbi:MAG: formylglycine-generating enzyme family protein [Phycisphaerae bacterium]